MNQIHVSPEACSAYYRRGMQLLNMTNRELANRLSSVRVDGQKTSETTVSRWMTGATPMDPGVLLYLTAELRALDLAPIQRPQTGQIIGVGAGKGGNGASTVATGLFFAAKEIGYKVLFASSDPTHCNNGWHLTKFGRYDDHCVIKPECFGQDMPELRRKYDLIIMDLYAHFFLVEEGKNMALSREFDLLVTPVDIGGGRMQTMPVAETYEALDKAGQFNRMIVNASKSLDFSLKLLQPALQDIDPWKELIHDHIMPFHYGEQFENVLPLGTIGGRFANDDLATRYTELFNAVLDKLGLDTKDHSDLKTLNFFELVDIFAPL
jgi:hypothetical protein